LCSIQRENIPRGTADVATPPNVPTIREGESAPDFTAQTDAGEPLTLSSLHGQWVILFFYPKDDTPG
jgi:cytochrome oxidase Cu insertion factor (SCO1/SenC/PrrC family)